MNEATSKKSGLMTVDRLAVVEIFYYYNDRGQKLYTSNEIFANVRAREYGTNKVFLVIN